MPEKNGLTLGSKRREKKKNVDGGRAEKEGGTGKRGGKKKTTGKKTAWDARCGREKKGSGVGGRGVFVEKSEGH